MPVPHRSGHRSGRLSYEDFRARYGMPGANGFGVLFAFLRPQDARAIEDAGAPYVYIDDPARVALWRRLLDEAARYCDRDHQQPCGCKEYTHTPDRTVLIGRPVGSGSGLR